MSKKIEKYEVKLVEQQREFYEKNYMVLLEAPNITDDDSQYIAELFASVVLETRRFEIKNALIYLMNVHDIYFDNIPEIKPKPWSDEFEDLLVKYKLNRD